MPDTLPNVAILTPMRDKPTPEYEFALAHNSPSAIVQQIVGVPVDDARNALTKAVLALSPRPEFCVWLDDDAYWLPGTIERLIRDLEANPHLALVSAWHGARSPEPLVNGFRSIDAYRHERLPRPDAPLGSAPLVVDCAFVGMHVAVHRTELLERLGSNPFTVAADDTAGEDVAFCKRIAEQGGTIAMDCTIAVWHVGIGSVNSEEQALAFVPYIPPCRIVNGVPQPMAGEAKRVVDRRFYGERVTRAIIAGFA